MTNSINLCKAIESVYSDRDHDSVDAFVENNTLTIRNSWKNEDDKWIEAETIIDLSTGKSNCTVSSWDIDSEPCDCDGTYDLSGSDSEIAKAIFDTESDLAYEFECC